MSCHLGAEFTGRWSDSKFVERTTQITENLRTLVETTPQEKLALMIAESKENKASKEPQEQATSGGSGVNSRPESKQLALYDPNKIYRFQHSLGGPRGVCVMADSWGTGNARDPNRGMALWGMHAYSLFIHHKRPLGFLGRHGFYSRFDESTVRLEAKDLTERQFQSCDYIVMSGEELNSSQILQKFLRDEKNNFQLKHALTKNEADNEWLNALGYTDKNLYLGASTINWMLTETSYKDLNKLGVKNLDDYRGFRAKIDSLGCADAYDKSIPGTIEFGNDEIDSRKKGVSMKSVCSSKLAKINADLAKLARQKIALTAYCRGNQIGTVATYVSLMDSGQLQTAINLLRANGCTFGTMGSDFNKANTEVVREGNGFIALKIKDQQLFGVTTINSWRNPTQQ